MTKPLPIVGYINPLVADALRDPTSGINITQLRAEPIAGVSEAMVMKADADAVIAQLWAEIQWRDVEIQKVADLCRKIKKTRYRGSAQRMTKTRAPFNGKKKEPIGVFVRLPLREDQARTFLKESRAAWDECNGSSDGLACESGLLAIGTPVTDGELPTEVVRVREHRKDIELPWTYHKTPPSDQDASEYELEFDRLITHNQVIAKLSEKDAEIARLRDALRGIIDTAHNSSKTVWVRIEAVKKEAEEALKGPEA